MTTLECYKLCPTGSYGNKYPEACKFIIGDIVDIIQSALSGGKYQMTT